MRSLDLSVRERSSGKLGFRIYAGGVAGDELDVLRKIRINQVHSAAFSGVGIGKILPMVRVLDLPYLFRNYEEIDLVHDKLRTFFATEFRKKGFEFIAWAEVGNVHFFSKEPITGLEDLSGSKVWAWEGDPIAKTTFSAMGVNPIMLSIADVTTALNTGMIDTVYAPPLGALALQWHLGVNYMTAHPFAHSTGAVLISSEAFKRLSDPLKILLRSSFAKAMKQLTVDLRMQNDEAVSVMKKSGLRVIAGSYEKRDVEAIRIHNYVSKRLVGKLFPQDLLVRVYRILERPQ
jgi:TRAP-type C4-dicarboxylate transport system substrate-binding protein